MHCIGLLLVCITCDDMCKLFHGEYPTYSDISCLPTNINISSRMELKSNLLSPRSIPLKDLSPEGHCYLHIFILRSTLVVILLYHQKDTGICANLLLEIRMYMYAFIIHFGVCMSKTKSKKSRKSFLPLFLSFVVILTIGFILGC